MTLDETCDKLEGALLRRERYQSHEQGSYNALFDNAELLRALVALGERMHPRNTRWSSEFRSTCERFAALKARAEEVLRG